MSQKKTALTAVLALMMAVMLSLMGGGIRAFASAEYIPSWEEYKAAGNPASTWNDVADSIDKLMEASYQLYVEGRQDEAYTPILNSYNFYYETSGFERNVNGYSGSEVSKAELQFKTARKSVKKGAPVEEIKENFNALSEILHTQANHLDGLGDTGSSKLTFGPCGFSCRSETCSTTSLCGVLSR